MNEKVHKKCLKNFPINVNMLELKLSGMKQSELMW